MIYLKLFLTFLEIGAVSFGGGYAMISLIREKCIMNDWLSESDIMNFIAVSESTPGPIAINMATFVGSSQGGFLGAVLATLGVVLPAFIIMMIIAVVMKNFIHNHCVRSIISGIKPVVTGIILATAILMTLSLIFGIQSFPVENPFFHQKAIVIFVVIFAIGSLYRLLNKKSISPIILIIISAMLGIILYSI